MRRDILVYGVIGGVLIAALQWMQYRFLVLEHSLEIYGGLVAITFAALGIWFGAKMRNRREITPASVIPPDNGQREKLGITPRELEILQLMAEGMSNREIAGKLFVSENTVKTHSSRIFGKLGARRRTQAVQIGKESGLLR